MVADGGHLPRVRRIIDVDRDPEWTAHDRDVVEAWNAWTDLLCLGCGQPRDEAWTRDEDYRWKGELKQCRPCEAIDQAWEEHLASASSDSTPQRAGIKVVANRSDEQIKPGRNRR